MCTYIFDMCTPSTKGGVSRSDFMDNARVIVRFSIYKASRMYCYFGDNSTIKKSPPSSVIRPKLLVV